MADNSWRDLETWERVRWARSQHFDKAAAAAHALGMKDGTYRCYERGPDSAKYMRLDYTHAQHFARAFGVRWEWLLHGRGQPWLTPPRDDEPEPDADPEEVEGRSRNHVRDWREYGGLTVGDLAKKTRLGVQTLEALEMSPEPSTKQLHRVADALGIPTGWLLDYDPRQVDPDLLKAVGDVPVDKRAQALEILRTFRRYNKLR